ncbi:hypothetical protein J2TS6_48170 [Paenibacillus albilobatus]|uniref:Helix-turn-helix domain-containing protein n=1 Tax=Paenibacillus albilobatus TaxID=2716884 RepID=A0A919XK37_9BACL|nr:helix-turn-helix domain-containing protein [Paenibacillus albilobatus]GIO33676.1 hypothetical protein J2TS6_48170 [Paenibacillus albilobatus]
MKYQLEDLPEVLEVADIQKFLDIGRNQAYDLCNSGQFYTLRIGRSIKIPKQPFVNWFLGTESKKQGE